MTDTASNNELGSPKAHGMRGAEFILLSAMISTTIAISIDTILPAFTEIEEQFDLGAASSSVSLTITVFLASMGLGMLGWGPLADRFGRKPMMYVSLTLFIAGALISTFAGSFAMFLFGRVIWGLAAAGPRTIGVAIVRDCYEGDLMARIMSLTSAVFLTVPIIAPSLGELLLAIGSWRLTTAVSAVLGGVVAVWLTRLNETLSPDNVRPLELAPLARAAKAVVTNRTTMLFTLAATMSYGAFFPWLGSSVQIIDGIYDRPGQFALLFGLNAVVMAMTIVITERLVKWNGSYRVVRAESALMVMAAAVYVVVSLSTGGMPSFWLWFAMASVLTAFNAGSNPLMQTMSLQPMGKLAGTASSITGAIVFIFGALLGALIDRFIDTSVTPFGVGFLVYGGIALAAVLAARSSIDGATPKTASS